MEAMPSYRRFCVAPRPPQRRRPARHEGPKTHKTQHASHMHTKGLQMLLPFDEELKVAEAASDVGHVVKRAKRGIVNV